MSFTSKFKPFEINRFPPAVNSFGSVDEVFPDFIIHQNGRYFLKSELSLPLNGSISPVKINGIWIEISRDVADPIIDSLSTPDDGRLIEGYLASDIPGIPGTAGARVTLLVEFRRSRIAGILDARVPQGTRTEDAILSIYRSTWGNPTPAFQADPDSREPVIETIEHLFGDELNAHEVEMPPGLLGNTPPEILVAEWSDRFVACTVGASDIANANGERFELLFVMNEVHEGLLKRFSEFCFVSADMIKPGTLVGSIYGPLADTEFTGWLTLPPLITETTMISDTNINLFQMIPVYPEEFYTGLRDPESLVNKLTQSDYGNFDRDSLI